MSIKPLRSVGACVRLYFSVFVAACVTLGAVGVPFTPQRALANESTEGESTGGEPVADQLAVAASIVEECSTYFWNVSGDGKWSTAANWSTGLLPSRQDVACVSDAVATIDTSVGVRQLHGNGTVVLNSGSLTLAQSSNISSLEIRGGSLLVAERVSPYSFIQQGGFVNGAGILDVAGVFAWTGGTQSDPLGLTYVHPDATTTVAPIVDLVWSGRQLQIDGVASIVGAGNVAFGGSAVYLRHAEFSGNKVVMTGQHVTITDGTANTSVVLPAGQNLGGTWTVGPDGSLGLTGGAVTGTINVDEDAEVRVLAAAPGAGGTSIGETGSVVGTGGVAVDVDAELSVAGTMFVDYLENNGATTFNASGVADFVANDGFLDIAGASVLTVTDMSINAGEVNVADTASLLTGSNPIRLIDGVLSLDGVISGSLNHSGGDLLPTAAGGAAIRGNYEQTGGLLGVTVGANANVPLVVEGDAILGGALDVDSANPLQSTEPLLIAGTVSGAFTEFTHSESICPELAFEVDRVILESAYCPKVPQIEASEDNGLTSFTVSIEAAIDEAYSFEYNTVDGTAVDGEDYAATAGTAVIPAGDTSVGIEVEILDDRTIENDEAFGLIVTGPTDTAVAIAGATVVDDDDRVSYDNHFRIDDIGSLGSGLYPTGINSKGVVGYGSWNADEGFSWVWSLTARLRYPVDGYEMESVYDVTESGRILGATSIREVGGARTQLATPPGSEWFQATAMNDAGVVAGAGYPTQDTAVLVRWNADGTAVALDAPVASLFRVEEINESGTIVGTVYFKGDDSYQAFKYDGNGFHILDKPLAGKGAVASGINDAGVIVGFSNQRALMWDADGNMTDLGPGAASDINNDGVIVGNMFDPTDEFPRSVAAIYFQGHVFEVADYVPDDTGYRFLEGVEINDDGVIAATATYYDATRTVVLTPFECFVCVRTRFDEPDVDAPANYIPVDGATTDGNPVRLEVEVTNTANSSVPVEVWVIDTVTGEPLHEEAFVYSLAGRGGRQTMRFDIDTTGMAWSSGTPADPRRYEVIVTEADLDIDIATEVASLTVDPRPMVLVHGLWSDRVTWANYQAFAQNAHAAWKVYAVDTMDTSSVFPNTVAENAAEVDAFVDQLRSSQNIWSVDLVGHSMGGLISRQYIQDLMPTYQIPGSTKGDVPAVSSLVMLGTPNAGSPCAVLAPLPATVELRPDAVALFNSRVTDRRGVDFSVAAGDHLPFTCAAPLAGDDVVPLISAGFGMEDVVEFDGMAHTSMTGSNDLFKQFVLPRLNGTSIGVSAASNTALTAPEAGGLPQGDATLEQLTAQAASGQASSGQASTGQALFVDRLTVNPARSTAVGVNVPAEATSVGVTLAANGAVRAELVDPSGQVRASISTVAGEFPSFRSMTAPAASGRWIVRVVNTGGAYEDVALGVMSNGLPVVLEASATQVHWSGRVVLRATLRRAAADTPASLIGKLSDASGLERTVVLSDDGLSGDGLADDGNYAVTVRDLPAGPALLTLNVIEPGFMRAATAGVVVAIPDVPPPNTAPVADALNIEVGRDTPQRIVLSGTDAENDDLFVTAVGSPAHGTVSGIVPNVLYTPAPGYVGPDSFTFVVSDLQASSAPGIVNIDVGAAPVEVLYDGPFPASGGQGENVTLRARVVGPTGGGVEDVPVTFALGDRTWVATTSATGYAGVGVVLDLSPGQYELRITTQATTGYRAGSGTQPFEITANETPTVLMGEIRSTEAGYRSRVMFATSDPERDVVSAEWDMNGDGVVDAITGPPENFGANRVFVDHIYPGPYQGLVTVTVIDSAGNRASGSLAVDVRPYEALGSLRMLSIDDAAVRAIGMDDSARLVLHRAPVRGSAPTRYRLAVLDRVTGQSEVVSIGADGNLLDAQIGAISPDGTVVAFMSAVPGTSASQVFVRELTSETTTIISVDTKGVLGNGRSTPIALSNDGNRVLFASEASNLGPLACADCAVNYVWDRASGLTLVSVDPDGNSVEASDQFGDISADGSVVAMELRIGNESRIVVRNIVAGVSTVASVSHDGQPSTGEAPKLNFDGSIVVFTSLASDLFPGDTNSFQDVVIRDMAAEVNKPVSSMLALANGASGFADISGDGTRVVFESNADPRTGARQPYSGVYVADTTANEVTLISREPRRSEPADDTSLLMASSGWITCDGRFAMFMSEASNLVPGDVTDELDSFVDDTDVSRSCEPARDTAPRAEGMQLVGDEDVALRADLVASDADGDALTYQIVDAPDSGSLSGDAPGLTYTPAAHFHGSDRFTFRVSDGTVWSETATVNIEVAAVNDPPTADLVVPEWIAEGGTGALAATATDVDGDVLTYTWATSLGTITGSGAATQLVAHDGPALAGVTLTVSDGTTKVTVSRSITFRNVAPTVQIVAPTPGTRLPLTTSVQLDTIVDDVAGPADPVACAVTWGDGTSSSTCDATHQYGAAGSFTIAVTATDGDGGSATATRTVIVEAPPLPACQFEGFYAPVDNLPTINTVKAGSNIPLKFKFCTDGRLAIFANGSPTSSAHTCGTGDTDAVEETASPGASVLTFDAGSQRYHYNWKTERSWAGQCRTLTFRLINGTTVSAEFKFK